LTHSNHRQVGQAVRLPNGVVASYSYDAASQLTGISYQGGALAPANLTYSYDLAGRRVGVGGSLASTQLPAAVTSAVYNANNQLTQWGTSAMTYDANGNTLNDGMNSYVWDARNRLASADNNGASFSYDPLGRRESKTLLGSTTSFLYDGTNAVQEQMGGAATANMLSGGVDEHFERTDATGSYSFLTDALGATAALTDANGNTVEQYSYSPYGLLSATGSNSNPYTYTGRESGDGLGLYYYRARYYNPATGRFLSEDPLGFRGSGPNLYAYVGDSPTNATDPLGLATYLVNRQLAAVGTSAVPWYDPISHTFTVTTNPDGSITTYSWGNTANLHGWNLNQPEDLAAAAQALNNGDAVLEDGDYMDPFYQQAFNDLNNPANNHANWIVGRNCKTEATNLSVHAHQLYLNSLIQQWWQNFLQPIFGGGN